MHIMGQFCMSYTGYFRAMKRKGDKATEKELQYLEDMKEVVTLMIQVKDNLFALENTSETRYSNQMNNFGAAFEKELNGRRWIKSLKELEEQKYVRYTTEQGKKWGYGPTEVYDPEFKDHWRTFTNDVTIFFHWGYWITYFQDSITEADEKELEEFDVMSIVNLVDKGRDLEKKTKEMYPEIL